MEPDYPNGSRWIIDGRSKFTPKNGAICVVSDGHDSYLKHWTKSAGQFESINHAHNIECFTLAVRALLSRLLDTFPRPIPLHSLRLQGEMVAAMELPESCA